MEQKTISLSELADLNTQSLLRNLKEFGFKVEMDKPIQNQQTTQVVVQGKELSTLTSTDIDFLKEGQLFCDNQNSRVAKPNAKRTTSNWKIVAVNSKTIRCQYMVKEKSGETIIKSRLYKPLKSSEGIIWSSQFLKSNDKIIATF